MSEQPTEVQLASQIRRIIAKAAKEHAIDQLTKKIVRKQLEDHFGVELEQHKKYINAQIQEAVNDTASEPSNSQGKADAASGGDKKRKRAPAKQASPSSEDDDEQPAVESDTESSPKADSDQPDEADDDGFSSLDETAAPTKKRGKKARSSPPAKKAPSKGGRKSGGDQPEAQKRLARLKSLVIACGVRKPWKKLYEQEGITDENDFNAQCNVVQGVLKELGMTGRGSIEQAKRIRDERQFRDEVAALQENVVETKRSRRGAARTILREASDDEDDSDVQVVVSKDPDEDSEDEGPQKRSFKNSLASFAADLNDSESD